jgi:hypothetical protein
MKSRIRKRKEPYNKSGKRGNKVYQRARYGMICYDSFVPANPKTSRQRFVRKMFTIVSVSWSAVLNEEDRVAWCQRARSKKSRRRLGQSWPLKGFYYYMRENVILANRGQPQLARPPVEDRPPAGVLPLLTRTLSPEALEQLVASAPMPARRPGPAPPQPG